MELRFENRASLQLTPDTKPKLGPTLSVSADIVCAASPREVQACLADLEQRGCIVQDIALESEELPLESEEEVVDVEWDFSDEDVIAAESEQILDGYDGTGPFLPSDKYVLTVWPVSGGGVGIDVPEMGGEAYRGVNREGYTVLNRLNQRYAAYRAIAEWLIEEDGTTLTKTPDEFLVAHQTITQAAFLGKLKERGQEIPPSSFSRYIAGARLSWRNGSIPLRQLFKE